jgi:hypothetical protein
LGDWTPFRKISVHLQSADAKLFLACENISRTESGALGSAAEVTLEKFGIEHHIAQAL